MVVYVVVDATSYIRAMWSRGRRGGTGVAECIRHWHKANEDSSEDLEDRRKAIWALMEAAHKRWRLTAEEYVQCPEDDAEDLVLTVLTEESTYALDSSEDPTQNLR